MQLRDNVAAAMVAAIALAAVALPSYVTAQEVTPKHTADEIAKAQPSGTIEVEAGQLRLIVGGAQGRGTLYFKGKSYPFTMKGGTVGGIGATKVTATGVSCPVMMMIGTFAPRTAERSCVWISSTSSPGMWRSSTTQ